MDTKLERDGEGLCVGSVDQCKDLSLFCVRGEDPLQGLGLRSILS